MDISIIVAVSENNGIGLNGDLPWHLPRDLKHFKETTIGKPIVMGRTTFESLPNPLPGRTNMVLTHNPHYQVPSGCLTFQHISDVIQYGEEKSVNELMVVGGAKIYQIFLPFVNKIYLTRVHTHVEADTFFPVLDMEIWEQVECTFHQQDEKNPFDCSFVVLERK